MDTGMSAMSAHLPKPPRVLACVLCRQRKLKCDRRSPCQNCIKSRAQCIPGTVIQRQRKRRFPERELIERLRHYESLLRQHNIPFKPLHPDSGTSKRESPGVRDGGGNHSDEDDAMAETPLSTATSRSEKGAEGVKNVWHVISSTFRDSDDSDSSNDDLREVVIQKAWDQTFLHEDDQLLLGSRRINVELRALHPDPVQIFRFWQVYLDNVNPLLKVTHTPTLQGRIVEAASNLSSVKTGLEALLFGIYCMAVMSLTEQECRSMFGNGKNELLTRFRTGCQQALWNCGFLSTSDIDCLTALYFYLVSIRPITTPKSLVSLLGIAVRIAQRLGIDTEAELKRHSILDAEVRRRLWWSLILFDGRITEISSSKKTALNVTFDCALPLNINDSDLRPEMKEAPSPNISTPVSESIFIFLRSTLANTVRNAPWYLDFTNPILKPLASNPLTNDGPANEISMSKLSAHFEEKYFRSCDHSNPINLATIWMTRAIVAKYRLLSHHWQFYNNGGTPQKQSEQQHALATSYALNHLEADIQLMSSPLIKQFRWHNQPYFPFPSYHQILQHVHRYPYSEQTQQAWRLMDEDYAAWFAHEPVNDGPLFQLFSTYVLGAWDRCESMWSAAVAKSQQQQQQEGGMGGASGEGAIDDLAPVGGINGKQTGQTTMLPDIPPNAELRVPATPSIVLSMRETRSRRAPGTRPLLVGETDELIPRIVGAATNTPGGISGLRGSTVSPTVGGGAELANDAGLGGSAGGVASRPQQARSVSGQRTSLSPDIAMGGLSAGGSSSAGIEGLGASAFNLPTTPNSTVDPLGLGYDHGFRGFFGNERDDVVGFMGGQGFLDASMMGVEGDTGGGEAGLGGGIDWNALMFGEGSGVEGGGSGVGDGMSMNWGGS